MARRIAFTSLVLLLDQHYQAPVAMLLAVSSVALSREVGAWWFASSDYLSYLCNWNVVLAILALLLMDVEEVRAVGGGTHYCTPYSPYPLRCGARRLTKAC